MRRHLVLVVSAVVAVAGVGSAVIVAHAASTSSGYTARHGPGAGHFVGYAVVLLGLFARVTAGRVELRRGAEFSRRLWSSAVSYFPAPPPRERPDTTAQA
jgi:hypothetical protein